MSERFVPSGLRSLTAFNMEQSSSPGFDSITGINPGFEMVNDHSRKNHPIRHGGVPLVIAVVVAFVGVVSMLIVDYGPWNKPQLKTVTVAKTSTTGAAARDAGATITPTEPKRQLEPEAPGPKPFQPANPDTQAKDF